MKTKSTIKTKSAFTIVELLAVVSIITILSAISIFAFTGAQEDARDSTRQGNAVLLTEALEKYYEKNGEYPSVAALVNTYPANTGDAVASKLSVPAASLKMPGMPSSLTNALSPGPEPVDDTVAYVATSDDNNDQCQNDVNGGCDQYTLKYVKEASGDTQIIESRRKSRVEMSVEIPQLTLSGSTASSINATWTGVGASTYQLHRSLTSSFTSPVISTHASTSSSATGLSPDTEYFFRVRAIMADGSTSDWSPTESETTGSLVAPTGLTITAAMSGTNARGTGGGGSCPVGATLERQIRYHRTTTATDGAWQAWTTGSPRDVAASEGYKYTFQAQARCVAGATSSPWAQSGTASTFRPIATPAAPVITATTSSTNGTVTWTWTMTCPTGTTKQYLTRRTSQSGYDSGWSVTPSTTATYTWSNAEGYSLTIQVQGRCTTTYSTTSWVTSTSSTAVAPIRAPVAPSGFTYYLAPDRYWDQWTWNNPSCGTGTRPEFRDNSYLAGAGWYWVETGQEGWRYGTGWSPTRRYMANPLYGTSNSPAYPSNSSNIKVQHKAYYQCVNTTTGRVSANGTVGISAYTTVPSW
jgi:type II secretory pathway pseudopilin PulG